MDCILVANECVEDCRHRMKKGWVLEQDLEKAYDYRDWAFLGYIMAQKGLDRK